jgi:glyoxylase-like metal-dependent hydrolase (beta-lactamase superfamily II)
VGGVRLVPLPGHAQGHTGYEFSSKGQKILLWGDVIHTQRVQLQHPEVTVVFDIGAAAAAATRRRQWHLPINGLTDSDIWVEP